MGSLKDEALTNSSEDKVTHQLTDYEANYLRMLYLPRQFYTLSDEYIRTFLYYVCIQRLGYKDGANFQFEFDFDKQDNVLTVTLLPEQLTPPEPAKE